METYGPGLVLSVNSFEEPQYPEWTPVGVLRASEYRLGGSDILELRVVNVTVAGHQALENALSTRSGAIFQLHSTNAGDVYVFTAASLEGLTWAYSLPNDLHVAITLRVSGTVRFTPGPVGFPAVG